MRRTNAPLQSNPSPEPIPPPPRGGCRRVGLIGLFVCLVAGGVFLAKEIAQEYFIVRNWHVVEPGGLYRSGQISQHLIEDTLREREIDLIVFLSDDKLHRRDVVAEREAASKLRIRRLNFSLNGDGTGEIRRYADAITEVARARRADEQVLVHCHAGAQRTGGFFALYRVLVSGWATEQARDEMLGCGHEPHRNPELIAYLNDNMGRLAQMLVERGVIDRVPDPLPVFDS